MPLFSFPGHLEIDMDKEQKAEKRMRELEKANEILPGETGRRFYHRALKPSVKRKKQAKARASKRSRRGNRR